MNRGFLLLFLPTFVFLTLFSGFYLCLHIYYLKNTLESYQWFAFRGNYEPSETDILFSGFRDLQGMAYNLFISGIYAWLGGLFLKSSKIRNLTVKTFCNGIILSLFLGGLKAIYYLIQLSASHYYTSAETTRLILVLTAFYPLIGLLLTNSFYRMNDKVLKTATHNPPN